MLSTPALSSIRSTPGTGPASCGTPRRRSHRTSRPATSGSSTTWRPTWSSSSPCGNSVADVATAAAWPCERDCAPGQRGVAFQVLLRPHYSCLGMACHPRRTAQAAETASEPISQQTLAAGGRRPQTGTCTRANPIHAFGNRSAAKWKANPMAKLPAINDMADRFPDFCARHVASSANQGPCVRSDRWVRNGSLWSTSGATKPRTKANPMNDMVSRVFIQNHTCGQNASGPNSKPSSSEVLVISSGAGITLS